MATNIEVDDKTNCRCVVAVSCNDVSLLNLLYN